MTFCVSACARSPVPMHAGSSWSQRFAGGPRSELMVRCPKLQSWSSNLKSQFLHAAERTLHQKKRKIWIFGTRANQQHRTRITSKADQSAWFRLHSVRFVLRVNSHTLQVRLNTLYPRRSSYSAGVKLTTPGLLLVQSVSELTEQFDISFVLLKILGNSKEYYV